MKSFFLLLIPIPLIIAIYIFSFIPSKEKLQSCFTTSMFSVELCPTSKNYVKIENISKKLQRTILLTEDSSFYTHKGFDQEGIQRCYEKLKETHKILCGGSTITQQLAKNLFLTKDKNFVRKGLEALITIQIEKSLTKKEIFEKYLNVVQFGKNIFGVKQAAHYYFKKHPSQLDVVESAFLAMVLPNPEKYSQSYYRKDLTKFARKRLTQIINDLYKYKSLSDEEHTFALAKLESFLIQGQGMSNEFQVELTPDDFNEMMTDSSHSESNAEFSSESESKSESRTATKIDSSSELDSNTQSETLSELQKDSKAPTSTDSQTSKED